MQLKMWAQVQDVVAGNASYPAVRDRSRVRRGAPEGFLACCVGGWISWSSRKQGGK